MVPKYFCDVSASILPIDIFAQSKKVVFKLQTLKLQVKMCVNKAFFLTLFSD